MQIALRNEHKLFWQSLGTIRRDLLTGGEDWLLNRCKQIEINLLKLLLPPSAQSLCSTISKIPRKGNAASYLTSYAMIMAKLEHRNWFEFQKSKFILQSQKSNFYPEPKSNIPFPAQICISINPWSPRQITGFVMCSAYFHEQWFTALICRARRANNSAADVKVLRKLIRETAYIWLATLHLAMMLPTKQLIKHLTSLNERICENFHQAQDFCQK